MLPQDRFRFATSEPIVGVLGVVPGAGVGESRRPIPRNHAGLDSNKPEVPAGTRLDELGERFSPLPAGISRNHTGWKPHKLVV